MSYVDAHHDRKTDIIHVIERVNGKRMFQTYPAEYTFYYDDIKGKFRSIYDNPVSRVSTKSGKTFQHEKGVRSNQQLYESDITPIARILEREYKDVDPPDLQTIFFDIEADFDKERGHAPVDDPFNKITAITLYLDWLDKIITLAIPPNKMDFIEAQKIANSFENTFLYSDEKDLLNDFFDLIEDSDILSGWNSEVYDIPYMINRVTRILSKNDTRRFCLWNKLPKKRQFERYGGAHESYDLYGRVHLDYMQLYRKYTFHEMHSYSLDAIAEHELEEHKIPYDGTLDQLYNNDFTKFIEYNRQDTLLLYKLDSKLKFIDLANLVAHDNTVLIPKVLGVVGVVEQAIINETHAYGMVVPDRVDHKHEDTRAAGAFVMNPKQGLHKWIGSVDINSLYPSAIRALNMSNETIIGQIRPTLTDQYIEQITHDIEQTDGKTKKGESFAKAWDGLFGSLEYTAVMEQQTDTKLIIDWDRNGSTEYTASEIYDLIFNEDTPWCLSANGSIFTYEKEGIIPRLLARWYAERKKMQAKMRAAEKRDDQVKVDFWYVRQWVRKIQLNSLYGALLNPHCRFWNKSIGQSTTLTGRAIVKHMDAYVNKILTNDYNYCGDCIIYGDSVTGDALIKLENGDQIKIEDLFNQIIYKIARNNGKEYAIPIDDDDEINVLGYDSYNDEAIYDAISYVMRHKTTKQLYKLTTEDGSSVTVTEDHSIIVDRDGFIEKVKPTEIKEDDLSISNETKRQKIVKIEKLDSTEEYVYDISIKNQEPFFFANNILLKNTDSTYFSAWNILEDMVKSGEQTWNKETAIALYNSIADEVNESFPDFMKKAFCCIQEKGELIRCGREVVGSNGLFIKKKRYAIMVLDNEGKACDVNGKPGKLKAMGLDLKRSDTLPIVQTFLEELLILLLTNNDKEIIINKIIEFKQEFTNISAWKKGTPKRVNRLRKYVEEEIESLQKFNKSANLPGHVRAAYNFNQLRELNNDKYTMEIHDGMKTIVCKLKSNALNMTSIAFPIDEYNIPNWFKELPFDEAEMMISSVDKKVENLLGILNWNISETTNISSSFNSLFEF